MEETREALEFDVLFVGGGPANLAGAIHLMNLAQQAGKEIEVCLIEKAESIGSHSLSGAILDPVALKELMPDYLDKGCPIEVAGGDGRRVKSSLGVELRVKARSLSPH